jgi:ATP-dependent 26S proteasome regulatory subunit
MSSLEGNDLRWALQRRIEDVFAKLGEKFGDLTGRVETDISPRVSFEDIGGLRQAKATLKGFSYGLTQPELYRQWGITPPRGVLLYGPPGTGKSALARALATASEAIFYHIKLLNLTSKFGANTGELLQEILRIAIAEGRGVLFLDEAEALSLEHLLPPPQAREASARLVATLCERLDGVADTARVLVVASTSRTDAVDSALVAPGRLDHLVEVPLPDADEQRDILQLLTARTEGDAGRKLFDSIDYRKLLPLMGGMSGADLTEIIRRALETKVRQVAEGGTATNVVTEDLLDAVDRYKRVRSVVEKIRYGQYL